jgi:nucleoside-diphosphate-sugar epimerase
MKLELEYKLNGLSLAIAIDAIDRHAIDMLVYRGFSAAAAAAARAGGQEGLDAFETSLRDGTYCWQGGSGQRGRPWCRDSAAAKILVRRLRVADRPDRAQYPDATAYLLATAAAIAVHAGTTANNVAAVQRAAQWARARADEARAIAQTSSLEGIFTESDESDEADESDEPQKPTNRTRKGR